MVPKVKQITLWDQASKIKLVISSKTGLERRCCHKYQVDPCVIYRKDSVILNYVDDCIIVSHKEETITSLIQSLTNSPGNYVLTEEVDISNYLGVDIKRNSYEKFKLSYSQLVDKVINHVGL